MFLSESLEWEISSSSNLLFICFSRIFEVLRLLVLGGLDQPLPDILLRRVGRGKSARSVGHLPVSALTLCPNPGKLLLQLIFPDCFNQFVLDQVQFEIFWTLSKLLG